MFTIRVYGLCIRTIGGERMLLVMDEIIKGRRITKFPGGGLEYGEGTRQCLVREIREELNVDATGLRHYYTTDQFQQSAFHTTPMQVISIYYTFDLAEDQELRSLTEPFGYTDPDQKEGCRWIPIATSEITTLSLPIDQYVFAALKEGRDHL